jgi:hypothetical protein
MSSTLNVQITTVGDHHLITGSVTPGGTLPTAIFIYENTGDGTLGDFFGTCDLGELGRLPVLTLGTPIPLFGNMYVRYDQIKIKVPLGADADAVVADLVTNVKSLSTSYANQLPVNLSYNIP